MGRALPIHRRCRSRCLRVHFCPAVSPPCPTGPAHSSTQTRPRAPTTCTCANLFGRNQINKKRQRSTLLQHFCNNSSANSNNNNKEVADNACRETRHFCSITQSLSNCFLVMFCNCERETHNRRTPRVTIKPPPAPQNPLIGYVLLTLPTLILPPPLSHPTTLINPFTNSPATMQSAHYKRTLFPTKEEQ